MSPPNERSDRRVITPHSRSINAQVVATTYPERRAPARQSGATERANLAAVLAAARRIAAGQGRRLT